MIKFILVHEVDADGEWCGQIAGNAFTREQIDECLAELNPPRPGRRYRIGEVTYDDEPRFTADEMADRVRAWAGTSRSRLPDAQAVTAGLDAPAKRLFGEGFNAGVLETLAQLEHFIDNGVSSGRMLA